MLLQAVKFKPDLADKHWTGDALANVRSLVATTPKDGGLASCSTAGESLEACVMEAAGNLSTEQQVQSALLDDMTDLGTHPKEAPPAWATPQSLSSWKLGNYPDRYGAIGSKSA